MPSEQPAAAATEKLPSHIGKPVVIKAVAKESAELRSGDADFKHEAAALERESSLESEDSQSCSQSESGESVGVVEEGTGSQKQTGLFAATLCIYMYSSSSSALRFNNY